VFIKKTQYATVSDKMGSLQKKLKSQLKNPQTLSPDSYDKSMNIEVIIEEDICDELQSKWRKVSVDNDIVTKTNLKRIHLQQNLNDNFSV